MEEGGGTTAAGEAGHKAKTISYLALGRKSLVSPELDREVHEGRCPPLQVLVVGYHHHDVWSKCIWMILVDHDHGRKTTKQNIPGPRTLVHTGEQQTR